MTNGVELLDTLDAVGFDVGAKHDPRVATDARLVWVESLRPSERAELRGALPLWTRERVHPWHAREGLALAVELGWADVVETAVQDLKQGPRPACEEPDNHTYFQIEVMVAIEGTGLPAGVAWLKEMADDDAASYCERLLSVRASLALCHLAGDERGCLEGVERKLASWADDRLARQWGPLVQARRKPPSSSSLGAE